MSTPTIYRRNATLATDDQAVEAGVIRMTASTDAAVGMGGWAEVLVHDAAAIDISACRALLVNHDADQIAGTIREIQIDGHAAQVVAKVDPDARLASGLTVQRAIEIGALKGVSIGYTYDPADVTWDEETRTATIGRWRLLEVTLTPIPADPAASLRSAPASTRAAPAPAKATTMADTPVANANPAGNDAGIPTHIVRAAEDLGLRASDYAGKPNAAELMLADAAKARAQTQVVAAAPAQVIGDERDKIAQEAAEHLGKRGIADVARRFAMRMGEASAAHWTRSDAIKWLLGQGSRAALTSASFNQVTILASKKSMLEAYNGYRPWSDAIVRHDTTSDFKTYRVGGLALGDFNEPGEGSAFTDLTLGDNLTGSGTLTFRGGLLEITEEALWNDELGLFLKLLGDLGRVAARHQDIKVAAALEALSFANASGGTGALTATTLATAWANFMNITGPDSQKLGVAPKFLVVPPALAQNAASLLTLNNGGAATTGVAGLAANSTLFTGAPMTPVCGVHLSSATAFYLMSAPEDGSCLTVLKHSEYPLPVAEEIDSGAVASRKFKVKYPMQVITATHATGKPVLAVKNNGT